MGKSRLPPGGPCSSEGYQQELYALSTNLQVVQVHVIMFIIEDN